MVSNQPGVLRTLEGSALRCFSIRLETIWRQYAASWPLTVEKLPFQLVHFMPTKGARCPHLGRAISLANLAYLSPARFLVILLEHPLNMGPRMQNHQGSAEAQEAWSSEAQALRPWFPPNLPPQYSKYKQDSTMQYNYMALRVHNYNYNTLKPLSHYTQNAPLAIPNSSKLPPSLPPRIPQPSTTPTPKHTPNPRVFIPQNHALYLNFV